MDFDEQVKKYQSDPWLQRYVSAGIPEIFHCEWFFTYETPTRQHREVLKDVQEISKTPRPLALLGEYGNGKTHLACAVLKNRLINRKSGHYYTLNALFRDFRCSISDKDKSEAKFVNWVCQIDCLIIDEYNLKSDSDAERRFLEEILDKRYSNRKQTIFIANYDKVQFKDSIKDRLVSRFSHKKVDQEIKIITFNFPDYRKKKAS